MQFSKEFQIIINQIEKRGRLYSGIISAFFSATAVAFVPFIYGRLTDTAIAPDAKLEQILILIAVWVILSFASNFLNRHSSRCAYEIAVEVTNKLLVNLFHHILRLPMTFHKEKKTGKIVRRAEQGIDRLYDIIEDTVFYFLPTIFSFFIALIILFFVEWRLGSILLIASLCYTMVTFSYTKEIIRKQKTMHTGWERAYSRLFDSIFNVHAAKSATAEDFEQEKNTKNFNLAGEIFKKWRFVWVKLHFWQQTIFALSFITVFVIGVLMLKTGALTPGRLIMFVGYSSLLTSPLARLAEQYRKTKSALDAFRRSAKYFDMPVEKDFVDAKEFKIAGKVVFENVSFGYQKDREILKNISFETSPGQSIAIVGESGVGKTTIVDLIGRYYLSQEGRILIDDVDIKKFKLKSLRAQMAIVPQEVILFNDTIKNNIKYGNPQAQDKEIIAASKNANAHEFIQTFPKKYDQLVGERGIKLSTGQKQRIAIARAILRNPKILILDEATSALDSVSERLVQNALQKLIQGRTTFVIAHRLSTIQRADKIIVLEKGEIREIGTHKELMRNPEGIYRNFWEMQSAIQKN